MPSPGHDLSTRIQALEAELVSLRQQLQAEQDADRLRIIYHSIGTAVFDVCDLMAATTFDADLHAALDGWSRRRLGRWLATMAKHPNGGPLSVRYVERTNACCVWAITDETP